MKKEYDFTKSVKNPYINKLKSQITIRLDKGTIEYFKELSAETGIPYQKLINLFLADCTERKLRPSIRWEAKQEQLCNKSSVLTKT